MEEAVMSWTRTSEWWQALREVSDELERTQDGVIPWRERYTDIFGDRTSLLQALRYRWTLIFQAQGAAPDWSVGERVLHDAKLAERHAGLLRAIAADASVPAVA
jgi:hypothetical protein